MVIIHFHGGLMGYMMVIQWDLMGYMMVYPLVNIQIAMENGPVEIVDFPSYKMVDLSMAKCERSPEATV